MSDHTKLVDERGGAVTIRLPEVIVRLSRWLHDASPWRVLALTAAIRAVVCGIWTTPNLDQWVIFARDPYGDAAIDPAAHFITNSPLGPLLAHTVGAEGRLSYALLHLGLAVGSAAVLVGLGRRTVGDRLTTVFVVLLFASPLSNVVLTWLGQPDAAMLGGLSALGLASGVGSRSRRVACATTAGIVLGFASFEQSLAALAVLTLASWTAGRPGDRDVVLAGLAGLVLGRAGVAAFLAASDVPNMARPEWARSIGAGVFVRTYLYNLPAVVFSLFGAGWLLIGHCGATLRRLLPWTRHVALPLAIAGASALIALDQTRVASMVAWPAALWLVRRADEARDGGLDLLVVAFVFIGGVVIPPVVIWEGSPYVSSWLEIRQGW